MLILLAALLGLAIIAIIILISRKDMSGKSFLLIVNHTFRTPLTRIKWMSDALKEDMPREKALEIARNISTSVDRLLEIVDIIAGIKNIESRASYDLKAVSLSELIEAAISSHRAPLNEKKITFSLSKMNDLPLLSLDTKKISFVIDALLENALMYSKQGGTISIGTLVKGGSLTISIQDSGIGLSGRDKHNMFKRFYRGERALKMNTDGMGLSLYLSKEIIGRHHGTIWATSEDIDRGTTLYISLPIAKK